jgi:hypothetical protein
MVLTFNRSGGEHSFSCPSPGILTVSIDMLIAQHSSFMHMEKACQVHRQYGLTKSTMDIVPSHQI